MPTYLISAHGNVDYSGTTQVPPDTTVLFYQPFGKRMLNDAGMSLQWAITHQYDAMAQHTLARFKTVALWNTGTQPGRITLSGDMDNFRSGIVNAERNSVVYELRRETCIYLQEALRYIYDMARGSGQIKIHYLCCL